MLPGSSVRAGIIAILPQLVKTRSMRHAYAVTYHGSRLVESMTIAGQGSYERASESYDKRTKRSIELDQKHALYIYYTYVS